MDPNGESIGEVDEASQKKIDALMTKGSADYNRTFVRKYNQLDKSKTVYNFKEASTGEITGDRRGGVFENENGSVDIIHSEGGARTTAEGGFSKQYATLFEETYHASDYDKGRLDLNNPTCRDEARAWKFATKAPRTNFRCGPNNKDLSLANCFRTKSITNLARILHDGYTGTIFDVFGRAHEYQIHDMNDKTKGLYHNKPIK